jgi:hypothetical protein
MKKANHKSDSIRSIALLARRDWETVRRAIDRHGVAPTGTRSGRKLYPVAEVLEALRDAPARNPDSRAALKEAKVAEEVRRLRLATGRTESRLIAREAVASEFARLFGPLVPQLEQLLLNQYPAAVAGLDVPQARIYGKRVFDEFLRLHREAAEKWSA